MTLRSLIALLKNGLGRHTPGTLQGASSAPPLPSDVRAAVDRFFDDSSLPGGSPPVLRVLVGGVGTGKTTMRRARCAQGYVVVDASEVFLILSKKGEVNDFPSALLEQMNAVGGLVAKQAVREKRHVVIETLDVDPGLLSSMTAAGYQVQLQMLTCEPAEAVRRNEARGSDSISAYFAQPYHLAWLKAAITPESSKA